MDILKAEIAKKRKLLEENQLVGDNKKFFKREELVSKEAQQYFLKYGKTIVESTSSSKEKTKDDGDTGDTNEHSSLPRAEVIRRLRERCEPILLYGETEAESFKRLRRCEILEPEMNKGFRNDFQEAMEKVDQAFLDEIVSSSGNRAGNQQENDSENVKVQEDPELNYDSIKEMAKLMGRGDRDLDMKVIIKFLQFILKMWGDQLNNRSATEKMGTRGKMAGATYTQTQVYLKPLLRKLKTKSLPEDISDSLTDITRHLLDRNYLQASDAYLQMAIGNAPWPIGVTMVGIHARTGREKIFSKNVAHVMNDETQRKYIQALKRLMTKCQEYFPTDPSKCVEYAAFGETTQN